MVFSKDRRIKTKFIITIVCLILSLFAIYYFVFIAEVSSGRRISLITAAAFWILSGMLNIKEYLGKLK